MFELLFLGTILSIALAIISGINKFAEHEKIKNARRKLSGGDAGVYNLLVKGGRDVAPDFGFTSLSYDVGTDAIKLFMVNDGRLVVYRRVHGELVGTYNLRDYFLHPLDPSEEEVILFDIETGVDYIAMMDSFTPDWRYNYED